MDEARAAAVTATERIMQTWERTKSISLTADVVADAVAQAVTGKDREVKLAREYGAWWHDEGLRQAEVIARLTTDLEGAEATNGILDEEVARLQEVLESRDHEWEAVVAVAVRAERERCAKFVEERWPVQREDGTWTMVPRPVTKGCIPKTMALAEALRRAPTEPAPGGEAWVAQAVRAERERVLKVFDDYFHPGDELFADRCRAEIEALRREPKEPTR